MEQDKFDKIETKLISQEHRTWSILKNFHEYAFSQNKSKSRASIFAIIFNLILSKSTVAIVFTGIIGYYFAWKNIDLVEEQNRIIREQNIKIEKQVYLQEASRRNNLVLLMDNILEKIYDEINEGNGTLSKPLIGRISALSQGFQPYYFLEDSTLTDRPYSPERGQLLLALVNSGIDTTTLKKIYKRTNFRQAFLKYADMDSIYLRGINLYSANLENTSLIGANLRNAFLYKAKFNDANLGGAKLYDANLVEADLIKTILRGAVLNRTFLWRAKLDSADLVGADLSDSELEDADLIGATLHITNLVGADLIRVDFSGADLIAANLNDVKSITFNQLMKAHTLLHTEGISKPLMDSLVTAKPELFMRPE